MTSFLRELLDRSAYRRKAEKIDATLGLHVKSITDIDNLPAIVGSSKVAGVDVYQLAAELRNLALVPSGESQPEEVAAPVEEEVEKPQPKRKRKATKATKAALEDGGE
jgi:hypothetical protein